MTKRGLVFFAFLLFSLTCISSGSATTSTGGTVYCPSNPTVDVIDGITYLNCDVTYNCDPGYSVPTYSGLSVTCNPYYGQYGCYLPPGPPVQSLACLPQLAYYLDSDGDGYGAHNAGPIYSYQEGYSTNNYDCNDANTSIHPGATDICGNGIDEDCNGADLPCAPTCPAAVTGNTLGCAQGCNAPNTGLSKTCGSSLAYPDTTCCSCAAGYKLQIESFQECQAAANQAAQGVQETDTAYGIIPQESLGAKKSTLLAVMLHEASLAEECAGGMTTVYHSNCFPTYSTLINGGCTPAVSVGPYGSIMTNSNCHSTDEPCYTYWCAGATKAYQCTPGSIYSSSTQQCLPDTGQPCGASGFTTCYSSQDYCSTIKPDGNPVIGGAHCCAKGNYWTGTGCTPFAGTTCSCSYNIITQFLQYLVYCGNTGNPGTSCCSFSSGYGQPATFSRAVQLNIGGAQ